MGILEDLAKLKIEDEVAAQIRLDAYKKTLDDAFQLAGNKLNEKIYKYLHRIAKDNDLTLDMAKKALDREELKGFKLELDEYIRLGKGPRNDEITKMLKNASNRVHISRLQALEAHKEAILADLYDKLEITSKGVINQETMAAYKNIVKGLESIKGAPSMSSRMNQEEILLLLEEPWGQGDFTYSKDIYSNYKQMSHVLQQELMQNAMGVQSIDETTRNVSDRLQIGANNADRLVRTEYAANKSKLNQRLREKEDFYGYMIIATLDNRTSKKCRKLDHTRVKTKDYKVGVTAPPFHPRCRTVTIDIFSKEEFNQEPGFDNASLVRAARDVVSGKTYLTENVPYPVWGEEVARMTAQGYTIADKPNLTIGDRTNRYAIERMRKAVFGKFVNREMQAPHMQSSHVEGRSYLYDDVDPQELMKNYAGTGEMEVDANGNPTNKETIEVDFMVGIDANAGQPTNLFKIHHSKKRTHIVPFSRREKE